MSVLATMRQAVASWRPTETIPNGVPDRAEPKRVLVVNDDQNVLDVAERLLIGDGHVPVLTGAPQSALQIARSLRPAAIFLDVLMPGFDGWDLLAALKSDPETSSIPVMMICMLGERRKALDAGADGVIAKPLDADRMRAAMARISSDQSSSK
ncbi:response regulator [Devosia riboflavina]